MGSIEYIALAETHATATDSGTNVGNPTDIINVAPGMTEAARQEGTTGEKDREPNAAGSEPTETPIGTRTRGRLGQFVRGPRSMGRYPFSVAVEAYLERIRPEPPFNSGYSPATYKEKSAKLRMLARLFNSWRADGLIRTSDPLKMGEPEINFLLGHFDGRTLAYIDKLLDHLIVFFEDIGNPVLKRMRKQRKLPREEERDIETVGDIWFVDERAKLSAVEGWRGSVLRFSVVDRKASCRERV